MGLGLSEGDQHLGVFTGTTINDNVTVKAALQALETAVEGKQAVLTNPVTGPASPTAGMVPKWGPSGQALVDAGTLTEDNTTSGNLVKRSTDTFENATGADIPAATIIVSSGNITVTAPNTYVICTNTCSVTPLAPAAGNQLYVRNAPGSATAITLVNLGA
jgi:hypothetical protein